jgi:two-component system, OmpR family, sensor histidine kinase CiaH
MAMGTTERLLQRTRRRLFVTTMTLLTLLVVGVGTATAVVGLRALDGDVDRALHAAVTRSAAASGGELPGTSDGATVDPGEATEHAPADSDTFMLYLDTRGDVVQNASGVPLRGLPDAAAVASAAASGEDLRTVEAGGVNVRLLTVPLVHDGVVQGYLQGGFVLTLHDHQSQTLVLAIAGVGVAGLVAAALITLLLTGRALVPIREGFEAQRRFVADASHELRTPAALIRANAEVLEREGLVADDGRDLVSDVIAEADRLGGLVGDLLQLSAWDETQMTVTPVPLDAAALAADTVRGATALAAERGVTLAVDAPAPALALADRDRVVQLLLILVDNAIDHSPRGGTVTVRVRRTGRDVAIDVEDEGPGIPEAEQERIFEPFTRLHGTTRHGSGGTGLGLAIARRITDAHEGSIRATSSAAGGARFTVTLPAAPGVPPDVGTHTGRTR